IPAGIMRLEQTWKRDSPFAVFSLVILLIVLLPSLDTQRWNAMHAKPDDLRATLPIMKGKSVFTDGPYLAARSSVPQALDLVSLTYSERVVGSASWSSAPLVEDLQKGRYDLVILHERADVPYDPTARYPRYPRLDSAVRRAVSDNYRLCSELDSNYIYAP